MKENTPEKFILNHTERTSIWNLMEDIKNNRNNALYSKMKPWLSGVHYEDIKHLKRVKDLTFGNQVFLGSLKLNIGNLAIYIIEIKLAETFSNQSYDINNSAIEKMNSQELYDYIEYTSKQTVYKMSLPDIINDEALGKTLLKDRDITKLDIVNCFKDRAMYGAHFKKTVKQLLTGDADTLSEVMDSLDQPCDECGSVIMDLHSARIGDLI